MSVRVKICGITNLADGQAAIEAGADALGFVFYEKSPRSVSVEKAAEIIRELPPLIMKVGVFVDASPEFVMRAASECGLTLLQFHGEEPPDFCRQFGLMSMKALRVRDANSLQTLLEYATDAWLLDAYSPESHGGTGKTFNWDLATQAQSWGRPIFLAGGLTAENVGEAVSRVRPFGVDVSSGVEASPGKKDHAKVRAFIQAAKGIPAHA
jgi:phosphoribosylanthranilate isomerase